jgi:hypothetical protein
VARVMLAEEGGGSDAARRPGPRLVGLLAFMAMILMACKGIEGVANVLSAR